MTSQFFQEMGAKIHPFLARRPFFLKNLAKNRGIFHESGGEGFGKRYERGGYRWIGHAPRMPNDVAGLARKGGAGLLFYGRSVADWPGGSIRQKVVLRFKLFGRVNGFWVTARQSPVTCRHLF